MKTATYIKNLSGFQGEARLYKLSEPVIAETWDFSDDEVITKTRGFNYVVVSAATVLFTGPETYIFGADKSGEVLSWSEIDGSFRGALDHVRALNQAGYEIVE